MRKRLLALIEAFGRLIINVMWEVTSHDNAALPVSWPSFEPTVVRLALVLAGKVQVAKVSSDVLPFERLHLVCIVGVGLSMPHIVDSLLVWLFQPSTLR